jgi:SWI/SNF-related matrix-associated actin-dependent regulator 1 of chromatin subfamily A
MITKLFQHQVEGVNYLHRRLNACLFWEVGTGKTNTVISVINKLRRRKLLILAPAYVINHMWKNYDDLPINQDYTLMSYEWLSRHLEFCRNNKFDYMICDECHKLKNRKSNISKAVRSLAKKCERVYGLTGTPYATSFLDVWCIFHALNIEEFTENYETFMHKYYICKTVYVAAGRFIYQPAQLKPGAMETLISRIAKHASVKRTIDCIELPELTIKKVYIPGMITKEYIDCTKGIVTYADEHQETVNKLACIQKLHQLSNGFLYDQNKKPIVLKDNLKLQECVDYVQSELEERDKLIIVYIYKFDYDQLKEALEQIGIAVTDNFDDFGVHQVLLLQEQKAIGVNLQDFTSLIVFYTFSFSYIDYNQAIGRIYRSGQTQPCTVCAMLNKDTYEEKIWECVQNRYDIDTTFKILMSEQVDV